MEAQTLEVRPPLFDIEEHVLQAITPEEDADITIIKNIIATGDLKRASRKVMEMIVHSRYKKYWESYSDAQAIRIWKWVRSFKIVPRDYHFMGEPMLTAMVWLLDGRLLINAGFFVDHVRTGGDLLWMLMHERDHLVLSKVYGAARWGYPPHNLQQAKTWTGLMNIGEDAYINAKLRKRIKSTMMERFLLTLDHKEMAVTTGFNSKMEGTDFEKLQQLHHLLYIDSPKLLEQLGEARVGFGASAGTRTYDVPYEDWMIAWKKMVKEFMKKDAQRQQQIADQLSKQMQHHDGSKGQEGEGQSGDQNQQGQCSTCQGSGKAPQGDQGDQGQGDQGDQGQGDQGQGDQGDQGQGDQGQGNQGQGDQPCPDCQGDGKSQGGQGQEASDQGGSGSSLAGDGTVTGRRGSSPTGDDLIRQAAQTNHDTSSPGESHVRKQEEKKRGLATFESLDDEAIILIIETEPPDSQYQFESPRDNLEEPLEIVSQAIGDFISKRASEGDAITGYSMSIPGQITAHDMRQLAMDNDPIMWEESIGTEPPPLDVYFDISGSMTDYIPLIPYICENLNRHMRKLYHFASYIAEVDKTSNTYGGVGGGTNFSNVVDQILQNGPSHVIVFTDDEAGLNEDEMSSISGYCNSLTVLKIGKYDGPWSQLADDLQLIPWSKNDKKSYGR